MFDPELGLALLRRGLTRRRCGAGFGSLRGAGAGFGRLRGLRFGGRRCAWWRRRLRDRRGDRLHLRRRRMVSGRWRGADPDPRPDEARRQAGRRGRNASGADRGDLLTRPRQDAGAGRRSPRGDPQVCGWGSGAVSSCGPQGPPPLRRGSGWSTSSRCARSVTRLTIVSLPFGPKGTLACNFIRCPPCCWWRRHPQPPRRPG